jgi:hypothetical protein
MEIQHCSSIYPQYISAIKEIKPLYDQIIDIDVQLSRLHDNMRSKLEIGDTVEFIYDTQKYIGQVTQKYLNGNINVKTKQGVIKIKKNDRMEIIKALAYDSTLVTQKNNLEQQIQSLMKQHNLESPTEYIPTSYTPKYNYFILNILTGQKLQITAHIHNLRKMINYLIFEKYHNSKSISDENFILNCEHVLQQYNLFGI